MRKWGWAACALLAMGTAHGESARMTGKFAAEQREVARLHSIAVDRFAGRDGPALSLALERSLVGARHFDVVPIARRGDANGAEGVISGAVSTGVQEEPWTKTEKKCVERDQADKCVRKADVKTRCMRRTVEFTADVRVIDAVDNRLLYSGSRPRRDELTWCEGEEPSRTAEATVRGMVEGVAGELARAFAPHVEDYSVRFRESTKDMPKDVEKTFKALVRQSQRDLPDACRGWADLDAQMPNHPSILFDLGLCAEASGDLARAEDLYRRAQPLLGRDSEAEAGLDRIARLLAAREDDLARTRR